MVFQFYLWNFKFYPFHIVDIEYIKIFQEGNTLGFLSHPVQDLHLLRADGLVMLVPVVAFEEIDR